MRFSPYLAAPAMMCGSPVRKGILRDGAGARPRCTSRRGREHLSETSEEKMEAPLMLVLNPLRPSCPLVFDIQPHAEGRVQMKTRFFSEVTRVVHEGRIIE